MRTHNTPGQHNRPYPKAVEPAGSAPPRIARKPRLYAKWTVGEDGRLTCRWETEA